MARTSYQLVVVYMSGYGPCMATLEFENRSQAEEAITELKEQSDNLQVWRAYKFPSEG